MSFYLVIWIVTSYDCPWGLGKAPVPVKELICSVERKTERLYTPDSKEAHKAVTRAGEGASVSVDLIERGRMTNLAFSWKPEIKR